MEVVSARRAALAWPVRYVATEKEVVTARRAALAWPVRYVATEMKAMAARRAALAWPVRYVATEMEAMAARRAALAWPIRYEVKSEGEVEVSFFECCAPFWRWGRLLPAGGSLQGYPRARVALGTEVADLRTVLAMAGCASRYGVAWRLQLL